MSRLVSISVVAGLCCVPGLPAKAENRSPPVVVTATRVPTSIEDLGSSVTVIDAAEIERRQWRTLPEALSAVPGLHVVQSGVTGSTAAVFMRGGNSNHTLVLIDGVRTSDPSHPSGAYDFANILLEDVERIEVVRSPQSTQYGSDAMGGVIQIFTRRGQGPLQASGRIEAGSFRSHQESASLRGASPLIHYALNVTHSDTAGQSITPERLRAGQPAEDDGYRNTTYSGRVGITPLPHLSVQLISRYTKSHADLDVGSGEDPDSYNKAIQASNRLETRAAFYNDAWKPMLAVSHTWHHRVDWNERQTLLGDEDHTRHDGERVKAEFQNDLRIALSNTLSFGVTRCCGTSRPCAA